MFTPNLTSKLLVKGVRHTINSTEFNSFLELGAGSGFITLGSFEGINTENLKIVSTDIMQEAKIIAEKNFSDASISVDFRVGSLFDPIKENEKFDIIVSDVAAISENINEYLPWYDNVPCNTGESGLKLFNQIVSNISKYLNPKGKFVYPVLSLCNTSELEKNINAVFSKTDILETKDWPIKITNPELEICLDRLSSKNCAEFIKKSGLHIFKTTVKVSQF